MSAWTCVLGWFRFTVSDSTADEVMVYPVRPSWTDRGILIR
jgi:hypothetical protein